MLYMKNNEFFIRPTILIEQIYQCKLLHTCIYYWPEREHHCQIPIPLTTHKILNFHYIDDVEKEIGEFIEEVQRITNGSFEASCLVLCSQAVREPEVRNLLKTKKLHANVNVLLIFWDESPMNKEDVFRISAEQESEFEEYSNSVKYQIKETSITIIRYWGIDDQNQNILENIYSFFATSRANELQMIQKYSEENFGPSSNEQKEEEGRLLTINFETFIGEVEGRIKEGKIEQCFKEKVRSFKFLLECLCLNFKTEEYNEISLYPAICKRPEILNLWLKSMSKTKESASLRYFEPIIISIIHNRKHEQTVNSQIQNVFETAGFSYQEKKPEESSRSISYQSEQTASKLGELKYLLNLNIFSTIKSDNLLKPLWEFLESGEYKNVEDVCNLNKQSFLKFFSFQDKIFISMSEIGKIWMNKQEFHTAIIYYRVFFFFHKSAVEIVPKDFAIDSHQNKKTRLYLETKVLLAFCYLKIKQSGKAFGILNELLSLLLKPQNCIKNEIKNFQEKKTSSSIGLEFLLLTINSFIYAETEEKMEGSDIWKIGLVLLNELQKEVHHFPHELNLLMLQFIILKVSQSDHKFEKDDKELKNEHSLLILANKLLQLVVDSEYKSMRIKDKRLFCLQTKMQINLLRTKYLENPQEIVEQFEELRDDCADLIKNDIEKENSFSLYEFHFYDLEKDLPRRIYLSFSQFLNKNGESESCEEIKSEFEEIYCDTLK